MAQHSQTGILLFLVNRAPIVWFSKQQNTVETSTFGSEFVAMRRISVELAEALRYTNVHVPNPSRRFSYQCILRQRAVTKNAIHPESTLKKKHKSIAYHRAREAVVAGSI